MIKSLDSLHEYYDTILIHQLKDLEGKRKGVAQKITYVALGSLAVGALFLFTHSMLPLFLTPIIFAVAFFLVCSTPMQEYRKDYKGQIISRIVHFIEEDLNYESDKYIPSSTFRISDIFKTTPDRYRGDDYVKGKIKETAFEFSEIHAEYKTEYTDSKGRRHTQWHTIFKGIFFIGDFNKQFNGKTIVLPDSVQKLFGGFGNMLQSWNVMRDQLVKLEDPEFENAFVVYSSDQIEARYILSTSLMKRIVEFKNKTKKQIYLSFVLDKIFVAIPYAKDLFEPRVFKTLVDFAPVAEYYEAMALAVDIVDDLNLNTRIWTK